MADVMQIARGQGLGETDARQALMFPTTLAQAGVNLQEAQMKMDTQKRVLAALGDPSASQLPQENPAEQMQRLSGVYLRAGDLENAEKFSKAASELANNASLIETRTAETRAKNLATFANIVEGVEDSPEGWAKANAAYAMGTKQPSPYAGIPYHPGIKNEVHDAVTSEKDTAITQAAQSRSKASDAAAAEARARIPLIKAQTDVAKAREDALKKVGGNTPKAKDYQAATDAVVAKYGRQLTPEEARGLAGPIAERAKELQGEGQSRSDSIKQAFAEAELTGQLKGLKASKPHSGSFDKPLALPQGFSSAKTPEDKTAVIGQLQDNMYYILGGKYGTTPRAWDAKTKTFKEAPAASEEPDDESNDSLLDGDE